MEEQDSKSPLDRRSFLKAAASGGAALVGSSQALNAQQPAAAAQADAPPVVEVLSEDRYGSDFMMDVLKPLGFDYVTVNPHSDCGGLQESIINYTGNRNPELITCLHEEAAVAMAHGFFKIEGRPLAAMIYSSVGLQQAAEKLREMGSTDRSRRTTMLPTPLKGAPSCADTMSKALTCSATCRRNSACQPTIRSARFAR